MLIGVEITSGFLLGTYKWAAGLGGAGRFNFNMSWDEHNISLFDAYD